MRRIEDVAGSGISDDHPDFLNLLHSLAMIANDLGRPHTEAQRYLDRARTAIEKTLEAAGHQLTPP